MASSDNTRNGGDKKRSALEPGHPGYKTPTQLRNARKRRKLKNGKNKGSQSTSKAGSWVKKDPSLRYLAAPLNAPVVQKAMQFFRDHPAKNSNKFDVTVGPATRWRTVAKLAVRLSSGCLCIGLFEPGTHDLLEIAHSQAHHPRINSAVQALQRKCRQLDIPPYNEKTGDGNLQYVLIHIERSTGRQQITLVWNKNEHKEKEPAKLLQTLCDWMVQMSESKENDQVQLHSLWVHYNNTCKSDNNIVDRDGEWEQRYGDANAVEEHLDVEAPHLKVPLFFPPQVFRQANIDAFSGIISKIRYWIQQRQEDAPIRRCLELYGGVGTIGLNLIDLFSESLVSSDENPFNKGCFERSLDQIEVLEPVERCRTIRYESLSAAAMVLKETSPTDEDHSEVIVVDPPRKGLDAEVLEILCDRSHYSRLHSLVYVSCGFDAFCRDFEALTETGEWHLDHAEGHLLFVGSNAIETLAFFTRKPEI